MRKILVTGGAGFIASHLLDRILRTTDDEIVILDRFTYASNGLTRLKEIGAYDNPRVKLHHVNIAEPISRCLAKEIGHIDYLLHMAASTHVDNSIACPREFIESNIMGTFEMLEYARTLDLKMFLYFSTDEVFGPAELFQRFEANDRYNSCNPYAATKAGGEELALAWENTYKVPVVITHTMNVIGERQHKEKFLPRVVKAALDGTKVYLHADPATGKTASRNYLHASDVADGVMFLLDKASIRQKYNIARDEDIPCLDVVYAVSHILGKKIDYEIANLNSRPGFDMRYGLSDSKMRTMGWTAPTTFLEGVTRTVEWMCTKKNLHWLYE
jgi:dTDP-glucose 4,6-dehydratase